MEYAPLSASCVRSLTDKLYEKRKVAALDIERIVKDLKKADDKDGLVGLLSVLCDFATCATPATKKGGLIALASFTIALGKETSVYLKTILRHITPCFYDYDSKIRYCACEALYNILKVVRGHSLAYFVDIFDSLARLSCDSEQSVRDGCRLLDSLMKEIIGESQDFDVAAFIPCLRGCLHTTNAFGKQFVVSWISTLQQLPSTNLTPHIPDFLDGLFLILLDPTSDIVKMCSVCLHQLLNDIKSTITTTTTTTTTTATTTTTIHLPSIINVLNVHCQSHDQILQLTSLIWLREITLLSFSSILPFIPTILNSILPCLPSNNKNTQTSKDIQEVAIQLNSHLLNMTQHMKEKEDKETYNSSVISSLVSSLSHHLEHPSYHTRVFALEWVLVLFDCLAVQMHIHYEQLLAFLLKCISDPSDHVVISTLQLISEISNNKSIPPFHPSTPLSTHPSSTNPLSDSTGHLKTSSATTNNSENISTTSTTSTESNMTIEEFNFISSLLSPSSSLSSSQPPTSSNPAKSPLSQTPSSSSLSTINSYFIFFIHKLLIHFKHNTALLNAKGSFIFKQLCSKMNPREVFVCVAEILWRRQTIPQPQPSTLNDPTTTPVQPSTTSTLPPRSTTNSYPRVTSTHLNSLITSDQPVSNNQLSSPTNHPIPNQSTPQQPEPPSPIHYHPDLAFTSNLIRILNTILFTSPELAGLRIELKNLRLKPTHLSCSLFLCLYHPWSTNPVATIGLCLLTQNYHHTLLLIKILGDMDVTVDFLTEVDQLVQLIESPIFSYMRLQLLDTPSNGDLVRSLYGLLMLLPQSQAFHTLKHRLQCIPCLPPTNKPEVPTTHLHIDFEHLINHFRKVQGVKKF